MWPTDTRPSTAAKRFRCHMIGFIFSAEPHLVDGLMREKTSSLMNHKQMIQCCLWPSDTMMGWTPQQLLGFISRSHVHYLNWKAANKLNATEIFCQLISDSNLHIFFSSSWMTCRRFDLGIFFSMSWKESRVAQRHTNEEKTPSTQEPRLYAGDMKRKVKVCHTRLWMHLWRKTPRQGELQRNNTWYLRVKVMNTSIQQDLSLKKK